MPQPLLKLIITGFLEIALKNVYLHEKEKIQEYINRMDQYSESPEEFESYILGSDENFKAIREIENTYTLFTSATGKDHPNLSIIVVFFNQLLYCLRDITILAKIPPAQVTTGGM